MNPPVLDDQEEHTDNSTEWIQVLLKAIYDRDDWRERVWEICVTFVT